MWILVDKLTNGSPAAVNMDRAEAVLWKSAEKIVSIEFNDGALGFEGTKEDFLKIATTLSPTLEIENA